MTDTSPSSRTTVRLVAQREFTTRVQTKAFVISVSVMLAIILGGTTVASILANKDDATTLAVTGQTEQLSSALTQSAKTLNKSVDISSVADEEKARAAVRDGGTDVAVIGESDGTFTVVTEKDLGDDLQAVVETAAQRVGLDRALAAQDVDSDQFSSDIAGASVKVDVLDPADPDKGERLVLAYIAVLLLFFTVYLYGLYVAMGVVEEKSSRVVELLLSTIKPLDLLIGKVIGIGAVGLVQVIAFGGVGLLAGLATGLITVTGTAVALLGFVVIWYVLGFTFFAMLYAAFGSLVSRQEDVNAATTPLNVLAFATFFAAQSALSDPSAGWISTLAWIPPFSATVMPMRVAAGIATPLQMVATIVIMLIAIAVAAVFAARVYENSVLNTGGRQTLKSALNR
ncbi:MAG: ABC transporter permease [Aeromicrobium sp.]